MQNWLVVSFICEKQSILYRVKYAKLPTKLEDLNSKVPTS